MNRRGISSTSILVAAAGLAVASHASAAILNWASAVSGSASTAARWSPAQVPTAADDLIFNATAGAQAFTTTFDAATATSRTMSFRQDTVTLSLTATHTTTTGVAIADLAGDISTVTLSSGTWNSGPSGFVNIADAASTTGTFNVAGSAAHFAVLGTSDLFVGNNGAGTLNITGTGDVTCGDLMHVGQGSAATGNVTVSGVLAIAPFGRSTLTVNGIGESRWGNGGDATVSVASGALAHFVGDLVIGNLSTSIASVTVGGTGGVGGLFHATLDVDSDLFIGRNNSAGVLPGTGTLTVNSGGDITVGGTINLGNDPDGGGSATLNINSGALVDAASLAIGASGTINHTGGTLKINGGTYTGFPSPLSVSGAAANNVTLRFNGNGTQTLSPVGGVSLKSGTGTGTGNLFVEGGYDLDVGGGDINLGDGNGSTGNATVTGAGSRLIADSVNSDIRVGFNGDGNLDVLAGGQCLFRNLLVPNPTASGTGNANISDPGSNITTQFLSVGQTSGSAGALSVQVGSSLVVSDPGFSTNVRSTGTLSIGAGGTFSTPGTVTVSSGGRVLLGNTLSGATLVDVSGELLANSNSGSASLLDAPVRVRSGGLVEAIVNDLTIGKSTGADTLNFDTGSTIRVGAGRTLTLRHAPAGSPLTADGIFDMQGGTIVSESSTILMQGGSLDQISGFGTFNASVSVNNLGACTPTGSGLVFLRDLIMSGSTDFAGTAIRVASTGRVRTNSGPHVMNCKVTLDAGSQLVPTLGFAGSLGPITMGDGSTAGVTMNGTIHMGTNGSLTFNDANGVFLGPLTTMNGGTLTSVNGLRVDGGEVLQGNGRINVTSSTGTGLFIPAGTIDPDAFNTLTGTFEGIGHFDIDGHFSLQTAGTYLCDIAGFDNEFRPLNDKITCNDRVFLSGSTLVVSLINGYVPTQCDTFTILTGASFSGQFATVIKPRNVVVVYNPTSVQLLVSGCLADMDDGSFTGTPDCGVTIDDLLYFLFVFEEGTLEADVDDGSFTGTLDNGVTIDDLLYYLFRFEQGC